MSQCTTQNSQRAAGLDHFTLIDTSGNSNPETQPPTHPPTPTNMSATQPRSAHTELVDNETPDETPGTTNNDDEVTAFSKAIDKIVMANYTCSKPKLQEPDPFDGSDWQTPHFHPPVQTQLSRSSRSVSR